MSSNKMKGLLKGLRYISQMFENEKETEIQIGYPTDVKHVAHIGWEGGSVNTPSWMNEFKSPPGFSSAPLGSFNDEIKEDSSVKWVSQDSARNGHRANGSSAKDSPGLPKSSRHRSTSSAADSPKKEKPRRRSDGGTKSTRKPKESSSQGGGDLPEIPKKSRRKKSKDSVNGGSSRSSTRTNGSEGDISESL